MPHTAKRLLRGSAIFVAGALVMLRVGAQPVTAYTQSGAAKESEKKEIFIKTPWGGLEAAVTPDPSRLRLPVYPGAKFLKDESAGTLSFDLAVKGKPDVHFLVGKFETPDPIEKVRDFYQRKLGRALTKFVEKTDDGGMAFEMEGKPESKYVQLKSVEGVTQIDLLRIVGLQDQGRDKE